MLRCEDCLPLIEEYFDGEVEETAAARMGAHLSSCATCAAALDALSFEQEIYARYDRKLEVTPDLWARVSAEIARDPRPAASPDPRRPFLSRVREGLAAALGALSVRPALASSLALLVVGLTAGSLWLARRPQTIAPAEVASNAPPTRAAEAPTAPAAGAVVPALRNGSLNVTESANAAEPEAKRGAEAAAREAATRVAPRREAAAGTVTIAPGFVVAEDDVMRLLSAPSAPAANPNIAVITADDHADDDTAALFAGASAPERDAVAARPLDPAEKEVARHVEQTQMLLRSIKNTPTAAAAAVDVAYEKNLSRKLLAENATLKLEAEVKGDTETREVLDRIEPFLLDIANLRDRPSREEVRSIGERVRKNDIVAALQVY